MISKLPLAGDIKYHDIDLTEAYPPGDKVKQTRGILEATFKFKRKSFKVFANHWPSQSNKDITRFIAARKLIDVVRESKIPSIVAGDFNTEENDRENPIKELMTSENVDFSFVDLEAKYFDEYDDGDSHRGTHYYRGKWSSLDKIFVPRRVIMGSSCRLRSDRYTLSQFGDHTRL